MTVHCRNCGQSWPRDPVLEVRCPVCAADVGTKCRRPSEHAGGFVHPHSERDRVAINELDDYGRCNSTPAETAEGGDSSDSERQPTLGDY